MANELLTTFYRPVNISVANQFDKHDEKKFHAHFWLWKIIMLNLIVDITVQPHKRQPHRRSGLATLPSVGAIP